jgi:hypothetical protein
MNIAQFTLILLLRIYQTLLSPVLAAVLGPTAGCRFTPSCSQYAIEAVRLRGAVVGGWLALRRLARCHPWGGCGEDVAQPSSAAGSRTVPVRGPETRGEKPPQPAGEDACATGFVLKRAIGLAKQKTEIHLNLRESGNCHGS